MHLGEHGDKEAAKELARVAKDRFIRAFNGASSRGADFEAAAAMSNAASAESIMSAGGGIGEEVDMLGIVVAKLRAALPKVELGELEFDEFNEMVKSTFRHLVAHLFDREKEKPNQKVIELLLQCNDMIILLMEEADKYIELTSAIGFGGLLRVISLNGGRFDEIERVHADAINAFKKLVQNLEGKGSDEARFARFLREKIMPDFNRSFKLLRSANDGDGIKNVVNWMGTDPDDPENGVPLYK